MGDEKTMTKYDISFSNFHLGTYTDMVLMELILESPNISERIYPKQLSHGAYTGKGFWQGQRCKCKIGIQGSSREDVYGKAREFIEYVQSNMLSNVDNAMVEFKTSFDGINVRCGYGVFTNYTPPVFDSNLYHGELAIIEFEFQFLHHLFYDEKVKSFTFNGATSKTTKGLKLSSKTPFSFYSTTGISATNITVTNNGTIDTPCLIELPNGANNPTLYFGSKKLELNVDTQAPIIIDSKTGLVTVGGENAPNIFPLGISINDFTIPVGQNVFRTSTTTTNGRPLIVNIYWQDAYLTL